jgi:uncharacterized protein YjbI with pentapeptide repeats
LLEGDGVLGCCSGYGVKEGKCDNKTVDENVSPYCRNCAGAAFEDEVADLFKIQGYTVQKNLKLSSTQNDFYAELQYGVANFGILVECKFKFNENDSVNGQDVRKFMGSWKVFNDEELYGFAQQAFIVTNGKFAPEAVEIGKRLKIKLLTLTQLLKKLVNFEPYLKQLVKEYENSDLYCHYINLLTTDEEILEEEVMEFLEKSLDNALVVLGDYGSGKTSFCTRLSYLLATRRLQGESIRIPIIIKLRDYNKAFDLEQLITDLFVNKLRIPNGTFDVFYELLSRGYFVLIFDGFDEAATRVDYSVKYKIFSEISCYALKDSKLIVTSRTNYFNQYEEFQKIFKSSPISLEPNMKTVEFQDVEIAELTDDQVIGYIESYESSLKENGYTVKDFLNIIHTTHDLSDLSHRPVLLNLIIKTLPQFGANRGKINTATLYSKYTEVWLHREDLKGKTLIRTKDKLLFTQELAWKMFITNQLSIHFKRLPKEIISYFKIDPNSLDVDHFSHDVQSCSFLNRDSLGNYKFIHKSFMEYFSAFRLYKSLVDLLSYINNPELEKEINMLIGEALLTLEIGAFFKDIIETERSNVSGIKNLITSLNYSDLNTIASKNVLSLLSKMKVDIANIICHMNDLSGVDIGNFTINNEIFYYVRFEGAICIDATFVNVHFVKCFLADMFLINCKFIECSFDSAELEATVINKCYFSECSFSNTSFALCNLINSIFKECDFQSAELTGIKHDNCTKLVNCTNIESVIGLPYTLNID